MPSRESVQRRRERILGDRIFIGMALLFGTIFCISTSGVERSPHQNSASLSSLTSPQGGGEPTRREAPADRPSDNSEPVEGGNLGGASYMQPDERGDGPASSLGGDDEQGASSASRQESASPEAIAYLAEVGFGSEYGTPNSVVRKWRDDIRIQVYGQPTPDDEATLNAVIEELQQLTGLTIEWASASDGQDPNVELYFAPESEFSQLDPNYVPINLGFAWVGWNDQDEINQARILIATEGISQTERDHLIREEVTQAISGCMKDSNRHADSIFYQPWTETTEFSALDREVIQLMYHPEIRPGMNQSEVFAVLEASASH